MQLLGLLGALLVSGLVSITHAQVSTSITADGTLGTTVTPAGNLYDIDGGTINGANQFHSFGLFSVGTGDIASFNGPTGIENILSRVTGGGLSQIDGTLRSTISGANLFLMNPSGILFGPNAQLDVSGSFHATTANYIGLEDGIRFNALPSPDEVLLTAAAPSAFGFLTSNPAPIDVQTGVFDFDAFFATGNQADGYTNILQVPVGQTLSFAGGTINIGSGFPPAGFVQAPAGRINLVSVASPGEATFNSPINVDGFAQLGNINIKGNSFVDAKDVFIRGGQLAIEDATVFPGLLFLLGLPSPPPDGGSVDIGVSGNVTITATGGPALNLPGIQTFAGSRGGVVPGDVPAIRIDANAVSLSGPQAAITAARLGPENLNPPDITINAETVTVADGASINLLNFFEGSGGTVTLNANIVTLANDTQSDIFTGIAAQGNFHPGYAFVFLPFLGDADSGSIVVNASNTLTMRGKTEITSDSFAFGNSGKITVNTPNALLTGPGSISSQSALAGNSSDIELTVIGSGQIQMQDGFRITAATGGSGNAGTVVVTAGKSIDMRGTDTRITSLTTQPADDEPALTNFAQLFDGVFQANLGIPVPDYPALRDAVGVAPHVGDLMDVLAALNDFGLTAVADLTPGDAGKVSVTAPLLTMNGGSRVETSTRWGGNGGAILLSAANQIAINGSRVAADSFDTGLTGDIKITAGTDIVMDGGTVSTQAVTSDGGNIKLTAPNLVRLNGSQITTSVESGVGGGGNINIDPQFVILNNSQVTANAFGGPGGNILIVAGQFIANPNSVVQASSAQSIEGTVEIDAPDTDIAAAIAQLPESFLDASALLPARCAARSGGSESSFVVAGRGGVPNDPDGYLPSSFVHGSVDLERAAGSAINDAVALKDVKKLVLATAKWGCAW